MRKFIFNRIANTHDKSSLSSHFRQQRLKFFMELLSSTPKPITILDLGGTVDFWKDCGFLSDGVKLLLLNKEPIINVQRNDHTCQEFETLGGDARDLRRFDDQSIDVIYSNSVIEHVGSYSDQKQMAAEVRRVGKRYFVQTPNKYFPIEPHFLIPGFQFMPIGVRAFLLTQYRLGWVNRERDFAEAVKTVASVRLLTPSEVRACFPGANLYEERFGHLIKSVVAFKGW